MSIGSGLAGSVGIAAESSFGTYAAPTRFHEVNKSDLRKRKQVAQGGGLAAGRVVQLGSRRVVASEDAGGSIDMEVTNKGMGLLLEHIFGDVDGPTQQAATAAYLQTHTLADNVGKSLTIQNGVPDTSGTVRPYTFTGSKVASAEFKCSAGEMLMVTLELDSRQASEVESLAAPSYSTGVSPFHFAQMAVKLGTFGAESAVQGIKGMTVKLERPQATDRHYAGNAGLKAEQLMNDFVKVTGSFSSDYLDKTILADRFAADSSTSLVWEFVGPVIASTYYQTFRIKVPMIFLDGDTPILDGPGIVSGDFGFTGLFDATNATISAEYISTDTSL
jgi:hypothetical protein